MLIDARCNYCHKFLCQIGADQVVVVRIACPRCGKINDVSLATVLKEAPADCPKALTLSQRDFDALLVAIDADEDPSENLQALFHPTDNRPNRL